MRAVKVGSNMTDKKSQQRESQCRANRKWSLTLSIMMLAVRVNQYQSNPVKTMSDGSTYHKALRIVNNLHQHNGI